jgi:DNA-binding CsgD family transcriptional regulator
VATNVLELRPLDRSPLSAIDRAEQMAVRTRADALTVARILEREARDLGLRMLVWHDLATLEAMTDEDGEPLNARVFGWSEDEFSPWHNLDKALRSPLLRAARVASAPLWISPRGIRGRGGNRMLDQIDLVELEHGPGPRSAIVIPVHMPLGQIGAAILTPLDPERDDLSVALARCAESIAPAIWRFVTGYANACRDERYLPTDSLLTSREVECLSWVAHGKTDFEISIILGCSHAGVRYHVTRACAKLGAVNRAQSVFRAAQLGYLGVPLQTARPQTARAN